MRIFAALALAVLASCTAAPAGRTVPGAPVLAITHATLIDGTGAPPRADVTVVVSGNRIASVGPAGRVRVPRGARVVDAAGKYLVPGLWDMHVHTLWDPVVRETFVPLFVANGVTGVRDMGGTLEVMRSIRAEAAAGGLVAPRIVAAGPVLDGPQPVDPSISVAVGTAGEARRAVDSLARAGVDFVKVYTLLPRDAFFAAVEEARRHGLTVAGHVPGGVADVEAAEAGMRSIEHMRAETGGFCTRAAAAPCDTLFPVLLRTRTWQTPTLAVRHARSRVDDPAVEADPRLRYVPRALRGAWLGTRRRRVQAGDTAYFRRVKEEHANERWLAGALHRAGVPLLAGSDAGADFAYPGFTLHDELALLVEAGLTPMQALQAATRDAAAFLGAADSLGTVQPGKLADLLLLDADPLADIRNTRRVRAVVLGGRLLDRAALDALLAKAEAVAGGP